MLPTARTRNSSASRSSPGRGSPCTLLMAENSCGQSSWPKAFENHLVGPACRALPLGRRLDRPGQKRQTQDPAREQRCECRQSTNAISDELRLLHKGRQQRTHAITEPSWHLIVIGVWPALNRKISTRQIGTLVPQDLQLHRVERHRRNGTAISADHCCYTSRKAAVAVEPASELEEQGSAAGNEVAEITKRHHGIAAAAAEWHTLEGGST